MSWRTVIVQGRCKLDYRMGYMVVRAKEIKRVFLDELAILVIENPAISITGSLIAALTEKKVKVIFCDVSRNPMCELVPHHGCHDSALRLKKQLGWTAEAKAAAWQSIIYDKILKQSQLLSELGKTEECQLLKSYLSQIEPGDVTNREGHAAKVYFNALFGMNFTRGADNPINSALNYGYSILLSAVNREISACGCLTQLGVFHDNQFNHFNLGCDLMEPFRILMDRCIVDMQPTVFTGMEKHEIWEVLNQEVIIDERKQTVLNAIKIYVRNVIDILNDDSRAIVFSYKLP